MPASGYTPISLYYSSTTTNVPLNTDLVAGELAINITDGKLFYKDNANVVQVIGTKGGVGSSTNTQVLYNSSGLVVGSANMTFNGTTLTTGGLTTTGTTSTGVLSVTGNTTLGDAAADTVTVNGTVTSNLIFTDNTYDIGASGATRPRTLYLGTSLVTPSITNSGLTSGRVPYASTGGLLVDSANLLYSGTDLTVYGITVGRGGGAAASNTVVGASALSTNTTGTSNTAVGYQAALNNNANSNTAIGYQALLTNTSGTVNTAVGTLALYSNTSGSNNMAMGTQALYSNTTGGNMIAIGRQALYSNISGTVSVAIGYQSQYFQTGGTNDSLGYNALRGATGVSTGTQNVAIGKEALYSNTLGNNNTAVGQQAAYLNTSGEITAFGFTAGYNNTTGTLNTAIGNASLYTNATGVRNTAIGRSALQNSTGNDNTGVGFGASNAVTSGQYNTSLGSYALYLNTTASYNTAVGYQAGYTNTTGVAITALGYQAAYSGSTVNYTTAVGYQAAYTTTGEHNAALGNQALYLTTTGAYNTAIGNLALRANTTASNNTAVGYQAAYSNTTGGIHAFGYQAGRGNTTGLYNTYVGDLAGYTASTANSNTGIGYNTLRFATGGGHTAVGESALYANTTGASNTAIGVGALTSNTTASNNTAVGYQAGYSGTTATDNTFVGSLAGYTTTSSCNIAIGRSAMYYNSTGANNVAIGAGITGVAQGALGNNTTGSNNIAIGVSALLANTTASYNTAVGYQALYNANRTADANAYNTAIGYGSGSAITTGAKNSILGAYTGNQGGLDIRTASNYIVLSDGDGNPRQVIDGSGNVGIGVTPSASSSLIKAFDFNTTGGIGSYSNSTSTQFTYVSSNAFINSSVNWAYKLTGYAAAAYMQNNGSAAHAWLTAPSGTAGNAITFTQAMTLDASGRVGIGETSPTALLDLKAAQGRIKLTSSTGTNNALLLINNAGGNAYVGLDSSVGGLTAAYALNIFHEGAYPITFSTNNTERARITSGGLMLINRTSAAGASVPGLHISGSSDTTNTNYTFYTVYNNGTEVLGCRNDGFIRATAVYSKTNASAANVYVDSDGLLQRSTSSLRYKTDVQNATHGLAEVLALRPVTYKGVNNGDTVFGGLIAEEVDAVGLKEFVAYDTQGRPDSLAYGNMVSVLVKAIQEQQALIQSLTARIAALEAK